jgi:carbohydrate-selective porin OprB
VINLSATIVLIAGLSSFSVINEQTSEQTASVPPARGHATTLTGEWFGVRPRSRNAGVNVAGKYTSEFATNVTGRVKHDATKAGQLVLGATIDTKTLFG